MDLALKMRRLIRWLDKSCQPTGFIQHELDGCYVTVDPARQGPAASANHNRVHMCGAELSAERLDGLIEMFAREGVKRFFVWLSPGPDMAAVRGRLGELKFSRVRFTRYPTLRRTDPKNVEVRTDLVIREVVAGDVARARDQLGDTLWPEFARSAGQENFRHYMAFDGDRPVAIAALCLFEDLGYLALAATAESDRQRGAQQALIARRIAAAEAAGCSLLVSETLTMLPHSLANLQRFGFTEIYEKEVFQSPGT